MKKITAFCIAIIVTSLLFTACGNNNKISTGNNDKSERTSYNPFDLSNEIINNNTASFGFGPVSPVDELTYTGKPVERDYFYDNTGAIDCRLGFMVFIDGIPQAYKIDGEDNEEIMHEFNVPKKSKIQFKVSFKPNIGEKGDKLGLYVVTIFNPSYMPSPDRPGFGNIHRLSQVLPVALNYLEASNGPELKIYDDYSIENVTDEIKKEYLARSKDGKEDFEPNSTHLFHLKYNGDYKETKIELKKSSKLSLTLEGLCGPDDAKYRTTVFIDNKPVKTTDGQEYLDMQLKKGMLAKQDFDIDITGLTGNHILSTISAPIGDDYSKITNPVIQSDCKLLVIKE